MASQKIMNSMRQYNRLTLLGIMQAKQGGCGTDEFGTQRWAFMSLQEGIDYFEKLSDSFMVSYMKEAAVSAAKYGLCEVSEVLSEPYVVASNPKNNCMTDLTKRGLDSMIKFGLVQITPSSL